MEPVRKPTRPSTKTLSPRPTTNWSAGRRWLMFAWIEATISPAIAAKNSPTHVEWVTCTPMAAENDPASIIASREMLMVPAFSATNSPHAANNRTAAAITALRYALSFVAMSPSAEKKLPPWSDASVCCRQGPPALTDVEDRRRQQQCQHQEALHHVGDASGHAGGSKEAAAGAHGAEDEGDEDHHEHALTGNQCSQQPSEADACAEVGDQLIVAQVAARQHDPAGQAGEAAGGEHRADAVAPFVHAAAMGGLRVAA